MNISDILEPMMILNDAIGAQTGHGIEGIQVSEELYRRMESECRAQAHVSGRFCDFDVVDTTWGKQEIVVYSAAGKFRVFKNEAEKK